MSDTTSTDPSTVPIRSELLNINKEETLFEHVESMIKQVEDLRKGNADESMEIKYMYFFFGGLSPKVLAFLSPFQRGFKEKLQGRVEIKFGRASVDQNHSAVHVRYDEDEESRLYMHLAVVIEFIATVPKVNDLAENTIIMINLIEQVNEFADLVQATERLAVQNQVNANAQE